MILLGGQGIWYDKPILPTTWHTRAYYGLDNTWTVYMCAQSLFKLHPLYDDVIVDVLLGDPNGHVVFTEGRRQRWTDKFKSRLKSAFDSRMGAGEDGSGGGSGIGDAFTRVHFVPRQPPGDGFMQLLAISDVVLHPYPFGGSRTSSEAMALGLPTVTLPTNQVSLRHRRNN